MYFGGINFDWNLTKLNNFKHEWIRIQEITLLLNFVLEIWNVMGMIKWIYLGDYIFVGILILAKTMKYNLLNCFVFGVMFALNYILSLNWVKMS